MTKFDVRIDCHVCKARGDLSGLEPLVTPSGHCVGCGKGRWQLTVEVPAQSQTNVGHTIAGLLSAAVTGYGWTASNVRPGASLSADAPARILAELRSLEGDARTDHAVSHVAERAARTQSAARDAGQRDRRAAAAQRKKKREARLEADGTPCKRCETPFVPPAAGSANRFETEGFCSSSCFREQLLEDHGVSCAACGERFLVRQVGTPPGWQREGLCSLACQRRHREESADDHPRKRRRGRGPGEGASVRWDASRRKLLGLVVALTLLVAGGGAAVWWKVRSANLEKEANDLRVRSERARQYGEAAPRLVRSGHLHDAEEALRFASDVFEGDVDVAGRPFREWVTEWDSAFRAAIPDSFEALERRVRSEFLTDEEVEDFLRRRGTAADVARWRARRGTE